MRLLFILFAILVASSYAWHPRVSPPANQLERLATGTDLYLVCQVSENEVGSDNVELLWFKDGTPMTRQKIRKNGFIQASLAFVKPTKAETGNYTCKATIGDVSKEETVPVEFFERAGFVDSESSIHPQEGENAKITCETRGDRLDEIFWLKNGYQLSEADERGYQFEDDYRTLIIPDFFGEKDDGNYSCNVVQFAQIYAKDISVTAYSRPVITVFQVPENNAGFEGSTATFKCSASGKPSPAYKWFKTDDDNSLAELHESEKYKIDDGLLGINFLSDSDAALYTCLAENEVGQSKQNTTLVIHRRPKIEIVDDVTTVLGNSVELICSINSDSNITDAYFTFNKQRYAPHSKNTVSYETVNEGSEIVTTTAEDNEESDEETATVGASVQVSREQENDDDEEDVESRKRRAIIDDTITVEWRDEKLVLTIPNAQMSHMGKYSCYAENMAGQTYNSAKVFITHAPVFTNVSEKYIRRQEGESAYLFCEVSAIPAAEMSFEHGSSQVYPDGVNVQLESTNDKLALSFSSLQDQDFGTYQCTAKNTQGSAEPAVFEIIKIVPPKDPEAISCADNVYPNYAVCRLDGYDDGKRGEWPTRFQVYYTNEEHNEEFDWENSASVTEVAFVDGKSVKLSGLDTEQKYFARIRAVNEAGEGELSDVITFETTAPWTPEPVIDAVINCPDVCSVNWTTPNDRGAEITGYKLVFRETSAVKSEIEEEITTTESVEVTADEVNENSSEEGNATVGDSIEEDDDEDDDIREQITINVGADDRHVDLPQLLPLRNYELTIYAINEVGLSDPTTYYFRTTEKSGLATLFPLPNWAVITLFIVVGLVLAIMLDAFCCKTRHCGVLACLTSHCRNRRNRAPKDIEQGTASGEHRVLITTTEKQIIRNDH